MFGQRKIRIAKEPKKLTVNYDQEHDVLYISVGKPVPSFSDEEGLKGLYIRRAMGSGKVTGATVMDYSKRNKRSLGKYLPFKVDFHSLEI